MKKTLLAAALLAGFAGAAHAQSSVTLYGIVDGGLDYRKVDGQKTFGIDSGLQAQSRFGIRGAEDLGNGLKAVFFLENGFSVDDGNQLQNGRLFGRQAQVGLSSATAGQLLFGRVTNLGFGWASNTISPFGLSFGTSTLGTTFAYQDAELGAGRSDNTVYYYSPVIAGFQGAIGYSSSLSTAGALPEQPGANNNTRLIDAGVRYDNGPIHAVVTYQTVKPSNAIVNNGDFRNLTVGGNYDFGFLTAFVGYNNVKNAWTASYNSAAGYGAVVPATGFVTATRNDDNAYSVGLTAPVGPGKVYAAFAKATSSKVRNYAVGYTYDLSKRTNLYTYYSNTEFRQFTTGRNFTGQQIAAGVQHRF